jgi:tetratricopeptide (TPR) repeat protein
MEAADRQNNPAKWRARALSARVAPNGYFAAMALLIFAAVTLFRHEYDWPALILAVIAGLGCPLAAYTDRVYFNGEKLFHKGLRAWFQRLWTGRRPQLAAGEIEWIETSAARALRSGGRVFYRYRCEISGNGQTFVLASGGASFRRLVRALFAEIPEAKLDARSIELRDHLVDPETLRSTLNRLALASEDLLKDTFDTPLKRRSWLVATEEDVARGQLLRRAANELYVLGRLREAAEAFRRALAALPEDAWLIYEFARFLHSQAGVTHDEGLLRRAHAALRLAARRGHKDAVLLARVGESFLEYGDAERAEKMYRRALEHDPRIFRAVAGLAEIGLRRGQLAHVLHHYNSAVAFAPDDALARLAQRETDYYTNLNNDEDYLETELTRLDWLQNLARARHLSWRVTIGASFFALLWPFDKGFWTPAAWSVAGSAFALWLFSVAFISLLEERSEPDDEKDE